MSELDKLLETYCNCTNCTCEQCQCGERAKSSTKNGTTKQDLESGVWAHLHSLNQFAIPGIPTHIFRPAAMTAGLMLGVASIALTQPSLSAPTGNLMVFSPNAPDLPSTLLGSPH